jgi:hypothetical protein
MHRDDGLAGLRMSILWMLVKLLGCDGEGYFG